MFPPQIAQKTKAPWNFFHGGALVFAPL